MLEKKGYFKQNGGVDFETFENIQKIAQNIDEIGLAIHMLSATGQSIRKGTYIDFTD